MKVADSVSLQVKTKYAISNPRLMERAIGIIERDEIHSLPSGNYQIKSQTCAGVIYLVNPRYETCNCKAGKHEIVCVHMVAFLLYRAQRFENAKQDAVKANAPRVALIERQPRTEWIEELDLQ